MQESEIRMIVESAGAEFIGLQSAGEEFGIEPLVLFRSPRLPGSALGVKVSQLNSFHLLLAMAAQKQRFAAPRRRTEVPVEARL